ncbi:unnamed protein product [Clavelina lepadiformis]|uniref:Endoglucanase n=2 Tax=Clavelina lepadiformis TaxID=159417 RepID=A0ABP0GET3_CLALP
MTQAALMMTLLVAMVNCSWAVVNPVFFIEGDGWANQTHGGYIGHFKIPISVELNGWWIALAYDQAIDELEAWQAVHFKSSDDRKILYLRQISWNKRQYPGMVMDQRYMINFKKIPGVNYGDYYGPRPNIVFLDSVYVPDPYDNNEHIMTTFKIDLFDLPPNLERFPNNIVTPPPKVTVAATTAPTSDPKCVIFCWVKTRSPPLPPTTTRGTTTPTTSKTQPAPTKSPTPLTIVTSCQLNFQHRQQRCRDAKKMDKECYLPQCYVTSPDRYRVIQCWKYQGICWCADPRTGERRKRTVVKYKHAYKLNCFQADEATTSTVATTSTPTTTPSSEERPERPEFAPRNDYNYDLVIHNSLLFYEAQRSGEIGESGRVYWRKNSHTDDGSECRRDLAGGYYVSGDYVKYGFPTASAMTLLAWGFLEFKEAYDAAWQTHFLKEALKWGADYFIKAHISRNQLIAQVGDSNLENSFWLRPQDMNVRRPCYSISEKSPGSDLAGETAAALAATAKVFQVTGSAPNDSYVTSLLQHSRELYEFAKNHRGHYSFFVRPALDHYKSSSYHDELAWASLWLYEATGENRYLAEAGQFYEDFGLHKPQTEMSWDSKTVAVQVLLSKFANRAGAVKAARRYLLPVTEFCDHNQPGGGAKYTPQGLLYQSNWGGNTRYACNAAFICLVTSNLPDLNANLRLTYRQFAEDQIDYILGRTGRSFVVGYGRNYPGQPHHRASSCSMAGPCGWDAYRKKSSNPQILQGALVGGPDELDRYLDDRSNYKANGVGLDYNAGMQGTVAGLKHFQLSYNKWIRYIKRGGV